MSWVIYIAAFIAFGMAISVARLPNLSTLSLETRRNHKLPSSRARQIEFARNTGDTFRLYALQAIQTALKMIALSVGVLVLSVAIVSVSTNKFNFANTWQDFWPYILQRLLNALRFKTEISNIPHSIGISPFTDKTIALALAANLGSLIAFTASTTLAFAASALFPVRWVKWARLDRYFQGEHNKKGLLIRRIQLLLSSRTPISGPSSGHHQ